MDEEMKELLAFETIHSKPVYTLAECVVAAPRDIEACDEHEYTTDPISEIKERFRKAVYLSDARKLEFLRLAAELSAKKAAWVEDVAFFPFRVFSSNGFVYLFEDGGEYHLVLPIELAEILRQVTEDANFSAINTKYAEMISYATALIELYGAYEMASFCGRMESAPQG